MTAFERDLSVVADMSGSNYVHNKQSIAVGNITSADALDLGGVSTPGICWFKNLDGANFVTIRNGVDGADVCQLEAGEEFCFRFPPGGTPYAAADTGAVLLEYMIAAQ